MSSLRPIDRFQIVTTGLFIALGVVIVVRAGIRAAPWSSYLVGSLFVAYGLYRIRLIRRSLGGDRGSR
jgi:hypothetical protein